MERSLRKVECGPGGGYPKRCHDRKERESPAAHHTKDVHTVDLPPTGIEDSVGPIQIPLGFLGALSGRGGDSPAQQRGQGVSALIGVVTPDGRLTLLSSRTRTYHRPQDR